MQRLKDAHYFQLPSQGNIYTFTNLQLINGSNKLLVASLKREVFCFEYFENSSGILVPTFKEILFTYIPSSAEIISMCAFNKSEKSNDFVIGITIIKNSSDFNTLESYLNIYSEWEESLEFNIENIAQNCLNVELNFIPYQLTHTFLVVWNGDNIIKEVLFLLSGSDNQVHIYRENTSNHTYKVMDTREYFPEFYKLPSVVLWMDVHYINNFSERLTAVGCECGYVRLCKVDVKTTKIVFNFSVRFNNVVSNIRIHTSAATVMQPPVMQIFKDENEEKTFFNLVVTNSILPAVVFMDVLNYGLKKYGTLPRCDTSRVFSCTEVADIDLDRNMEILIGSSSKEILLYKFNHKKGWYLKDVKKLAAPILSLNYMDVTGDGVKELVVFTLKGVHILKHEVSFIQEVLEEKIHSLKVPST